MCPTPEAEMITVLEQVKKAGGVLDVAAEAARIAKLYGVEAEDIARELTESGLLAGLNLALGAQK